MNVARLRARLEKPRLFLWRVGLGIFALTWLLRLEGMRVVRDAGPEILGRWEEQLLLGGVPALGVLVLAPVVVVVAAFSMAVPSVQRRVGRIAWAVAAAIVGGSLALDLSTGRKAH